MTRAQRPRLAADRRRAYGWPANAPARCRQSLARPAPGRGRSPARRGRLRAGEKQTRSLEAVIAAPISTEELLAGKAIAAITPAVLTVWLAYGVLIGVAALTLGGAITRVIMDPTWFATVFALGPAIGLVSVVVGIAISSRA